MAKPPSGVVFLFVFSFINRIFVCLLYKGEMISAICWIPKGSLKNVLFVDEPLTQGEIDEAIKSFSLDRG